MNLLEVANILTCNKNSSLVPWAGDGGRVRRRDWSRANPLEIGKQQRHFDMIGQKGDTDLLGICLIKCQVTCWM